MMVVSENVDAHLDRILAVVRHGLDNNAGTSEAIARSWTRCINDYRLDPTHQRVPPMLSARELREHHERLADVIECAKLEMTSLYQQLGDQDCAVVLTGRGGEILHMVSSPHFAEDVAPLGFRVGAIWSEEAAGTNGMGTCIAAGAPVAVCRTDHFYPQYTSLTCSAVPVYDQDGAITAVLDVTSRSQLLQQHSLVLLGMTAQTIENHLLDARFRDAFPIHFHSRPEFVYTLHAGKLVVDAGGGVIAANRSALFQLGLRSLEEARRRRFDEIFQTTLEDLLQRSIASSFHPVPIYATRASNRFFGVAQQPAAAFDAAARLRAIASSAATTTGAPALRARARSAESEAELEFGDPRISKHLALARRVITRRIPVLVHGETGVGKEVFAKAVHDGSPSAGGSFVAVNCASLPESLIESELFGYRAGAFTGAQRSGRRGKILQADKGTLFLDEIGDMPLALQARLLRVLDERRVTPLGAEETHDVDFQLISASHRNLEQCVRDGTFREDLYYRLSGVLITLPPLRERLDKMALIRRILAEETAHFTLAPDAEAALLAHSWPGNVRQLRHVLRTLAALYEGETVTRERLLRQIPACNDHAPEATAEMPAPPIEADEPRAERGDAATADRRAADAAGGGADLNPIQVNERQVLLRLLQDHRWNMSNVAKALDISRNTLYRKLHRLHIELSHSRRSN
jgi:transcriptional regulator of acetoin/glycerol metabolism